MYKQIEYKLKKTKLYGTYLSEPDVHDSHIISIVINNKDITIQFERKDVSIVYSITFKQVVKMHIDNFEEGNTADFICVESFKHSALSEDKWKEMIKKLYSYGGELEDKKALNAINKIKKEELFYIAVFSSYGAEIRIVCEELETTKETSF